MWARNIFLGLSHMLKICLIRIGNERAWNRLKLRPAAEIRSEWRECSHYFSGRFFFSKITEMKWKGREVIATVLPISVETFKCRNYTRSKNPHFRIADQSYVEFFHEKEVTNLQISEPYVETCKFRNRCFGRAIFLTFQISFWFKTYQWLQNGEGIFFQKKIARK